MSVGLCSAWSREKAAEEEEPFSFTVTTSGAPYAHMTDSFAGNCIYDKCSNFAAIDLGDELNANIEMDERLEDYTYKNGDEPLTISLPVIETFCW